MNLAYTPLLTPGTPFPLSDADTPEMERWGKHSAPDVFTDLHAVGDMTLGWFSYTRQYDARNFTAYGRTQDGLRIARRMSPAHRMEDALVPA